MSHSDKQDRTIPSYEEIAKETFGTLWAEATLGDWALIVHYMRTAPRSATAPTGQRAVAETVYDNWSAYLRPCDRGDFKKKLYAIAATLPQQPAVAEGWVLVCRKCGADADQSCGWPMNCPAKHPKSAAAPKQEGKEEPR